jgi:hypothetical protein
VRTKWCLAVVLAVAALPGLRASSPAPPVGPAPSVPRLVEQLGDPDYRERDRAGRLLRGLGPQALAELRPARDHADPEVRRRVQEIVADLETVELLAPKLVTLDLKDRTLRQVFQEITRQTGYKVEAMGGNEQHRYSFKFQRIPFWEAIDRVSNASGLVYMPWYGDNAVHLQAQESYVPYLCYDGGFRLVANSFQQSRSIDFGALPKNPLGGTHPDGLSFTFSVCAEPRLPLLGAGEPRLEAAYDNLNNSMVPRPDNDPNGMMNRTVMRYGNGYHVLCQQLQLNLARPSEKATSVKLLKGTVPLTVLVSEKPEVVTDKLMTTKGKKFKAGGATFAIEDVSATPGGQYQLKMTITNNSKDASDNDYTWINSLFHRVEVQDDKGHKYQHFGSNWMNSSARHVQIQFTYGQPGNAKLPPPSKLIYHVWATAQTQATFTFKNLPLP